MNRPNIIPGVSIVALGATLAAGLAMPMPAFGQPVADRTLSDVKVDNVGACTTLTVNFNIRVQFLSAFPETGGRELHIRLSPLDTAHSNGGRESLRTPASLPGLRSIQYEGDSAGGPVLSLFFAKDTNFSVEPGEQAQQLVIHLSDPASAGACKSAVTTSVAPPAPTSLPNQTVTSTVAIPAGLFALNLRSVPAAVSDLTPQEKSAVAGKVVYETLFERESQQWHRLRMGFFETREAADAARVKLKAQFPEAWVVKVTADERAQGVASRKNLGAVEAASVTPATPQTAAAPTDVTDTAKLIDDAENAIRDSNPDRAIQLLTNALARPENANTPRALELLGVTREKKGQAAHAQAEYEEYLRRYPSGEAADRVRQRLAALTQGSASAPTPALRQANGSLKSAAAWTWGMRGSFSQFYFRDQSRTRLPDTSSTLGSEVDSSVNVNQLLTSGDITLTGGNDRQQFQLRAAGSYTQNFGTSVSRTTINNGTNTTAFTSKPGGGQSALTALYLDWSHTDLATQLRVGRQTRNSAGVLGRFDGALLGWQAQPKLRFNAVAGYPVLSSRQTWVLKERPFYGVSVDVGNKRSPLQTSFYWFDQHTKGGFIDRRSLGFEARLLKKNFNAFTIIDYDVKFKQLNLGLLSMSYNFPDSSNLTVTADYRRSPLLTTNNGLIGQVLTATSEPVPDLAGLRPFFTDAEIYQLAKDRTLIAKSMTLSYSRPLTKKLQANVDLTLTDTGGTPGTAASSGTMAVPGIPATGKEYYYGAQLIGSGLLWENDIYIFSARYANTQRSNAWTGDFNARVPITNTFRLNPRMRYGYRKDKLTGDSLTQLQPTMRFNWFPLKHGEVEIEFGGDFSHQRQRDLNTGTFATTSQSGYVLSAGYRLDF